MADVAALIDDIFFQAKVAETAKHLGIELKMCTTADAFGAEIANGEPKLVLIDLNARSNPFDAISVTKANAPDVPLLAFFSHVQTELAEKARAAGCTEVMPRSKFTRDLATILARAKSHS